ncbi:MraY family glycosyltransferase [Pseudomonas massiliensis]|uniref:MraY family glycosyltransferase n=1 Tax=Pseudomonas massiliensis TaxID=522492 RepID=UPI0005910D28|nr:glycosyltransferase family 4 protein [Pseudomonas massiliensis]
MIIVIGLAVFTLAVSLTWGMRGYALRKQLMDVPNSRSSHTVPTPRGGGVGIVGALVLGLPAAVYLGLLTAADASLLALPGLGVAVLGFADDHGHIAARWRLLGHFIAAAAGLALLDKWPVVPLYQHVCLAGLWVSIPLVFGLVWLLNLYNFMDGIDGIAGVQAVTVCLSLAWLGYLYATPADVALALMLVAAAAGFLCWNLPPAKIFMGDAGSGFLGLVIGLLWLKIASHAPQVFWPGLVLMGVFVVDATWTLVVRLRRGEKLYQAHRSHGYQHAAQRWGHGRVTATVAVLNLGWLLPMGWVIADGGLPIAVGVPIALSPILWLAWRSGAGLSKGRLDK